MSLRTVTAICESLNLHVLHALISNKYSHVVCMHAYFNVYTCNCIWVLKHRVKLVKEITTALWLNEHTQYNFVKEYFQALLRRDYLDLLYID